MTAKDFHSQLTQLIGKVNHASAVALLRKAYAALLSKCDCGQCSACETAQQIDDALGGKVASKHKAAKRKKKR